MAWKDTLQDAAWRGVKFDARATRDRIERAVAQYEYPHRDGAETDDLGAKARTVNLTAVLWGSDYEARLSSLLAALGQSGAGELVHPVHGKLTAQLLSVEVRHDEDQPDRCELDLAFLESAAPAPFFAATTAGQQAAAIATKIATAQDGALARFSAKARALTAQLRGLRRQADALTRLGAVTSAVRGDVRGVILAGLDALTYPTSWATDIRSLLQARVTVPRTALATIRGSLSGWTILRNALLGVDRDSGAMARPVSAGKTVQGVSTLQAWLPPSAVTSALGTAVPYTERTDAEAPIRVQLLAQDLVRRERALLLADAAADLVQLEADEPSLTPAELASVAADVRGQLQDAIDSAHMTLPLEDAHDIAEGLRDVALGLQLATEAVIVARPPLLQRPAPGDGNLHLVAHWWYGDATRAAELGRLNPGVARRTFVQRGELLHGYAR